MPERHPVIVSPMLEKLRREQAALKERISYYARENTMLESQLEKINRETERAYRRHEELAELIRTEELRVLRVGRR